MRANTNMTDMNYARGFIQRKETFGFASADCKRSKALYPRMQVLCRQDVQAG